MDFNHFYTGKAEPTYFLSFDNGVINYNFSGAISEKPLLEKDGIIVRQVSSAFSILNTLKMLEYAIINRKVIKNQQEKINYNKNYCNWIINSIEISKVQDFIINNESELVRKIKEVKIYRPEKKNHWGVTYFWKNNSYHIIFKKGREEKVITTLDNVYDFQKKYNVVFIFETKELFIVVEKFKNNKVSKKWKIINIEENYKLFKIEKLSYDKYSMSTNYYSNEVGRQPKDRIMIYSKSYDKLIQDLDILMKN